MVEENMKKTLLTTAILTSLSFVPAYADDSVDEHILVTANRTQQDSFAVLSANQIFTRDDIEALNIVSVTDILSQVAGFTVANQGGAGQQSSVFSRGTESNHILVLVDGVRVGSATLGSTNFAAMSSQQIERIEVVKGPRAALWGSDAIGGVIQIFTKQYDNGEGQVNAGIGSNGFYQAGVSIGFGNGQHKYTLNLSVEQEDGFNIFESDPNNPSDINEPDEDGYDRQSLSVVGTSEVNSHFKLDVVARYEQGESEFDASYPDSPCWWDASEACPAFYANEQKTDNYHGKVAGIYQEDALFVELAIATSQDQGERFGTGNNESSKDRITTERDQAYLVAHYDLSEQTGLTFGYDWYQEQVSTNKDKDDWTEGFQSWAVDSRDVEAVFVQARHEIGSFLFEGAVRYDDIENIGSENTYNLAVGYQIDEQWLVSLNQGSGFKAPTFNDLYWPGSGNKDLAAETSETTEILVRHQADDLRIELSVFDTDVENLIAWAPNGDGIWQPSNVNQAQMRGGDISIAFSRDVFDHNIALAYVDAEDATTGIQLKRRPLWTADYAVTYELDEWRFNTNIGYRGRSVDSAPVKSYWIIDLAAQYQVTPELSVAAKVENAFNEDYENATSYVSDGTSYRLTARYAF